MTATPVQTPLALANADAARFPATADGFLTPEQKAAYDREGYCVLTGLLTPDDLSGVRAAMAEKVDDIANECHAAGLIPELYADEPLDSRLAKISEHLTHDQFLKYGRSWRERREGYFHLMSNPKILNAVESLIGPELFANPVYNTRPKVPGHSAGAVPWHQDKSYWPDANSNPVITVWIPVVDATEVNGCLYVWPRTHRTRMLSYHAEEKSGTQYTQIDDKHLSRIEREQVALPVPAGSAILFNDRCVHMSTPNQADTVRWSVDLRYQPTDQDPMPQHGAGFLARSHERPEAVADLQDWLAERPEHATA